jgi:hypothetical protein
MSDFTCSNSLISTSEFNQLLNDNQLETTSLNPSFSLGEEKTLKN